MWAVAGAETAGIGRGVDGRRQPELGEHGIDSTGANAMDWRHERYRGDALSTTECLPGPETNGSSNDDDRSGGEVRGAV